MPSGCRPLRAYPPPGPAMSIRLPIFSLLAISTAAAAAALVGPPVGAQVLPTRTGAAAPAVTTGAARAPATTVALDLQRSVALRGAAPVAATTVHAAGSVLLLADGIVADAHIAPLPAPAPGFVYER